MTGLYLETLILAFALSADCFGVGVAAGIKFGKPRQVFRLSWHFGLFQSLMCGIGLWAGAILLSFIQHWDHWLACVLLSAIGFKMIKEASEEDDDKTKLVHDITKGFSLVLLSISVSIDALAAGIGLAASHAPAIFAVLTIGIVSSLVTLAAMVFAKRFSHYLGKRVEMIGGVILIIIGVKIVLEHLQII